MNGITAQHGARHLQFVANEDISSYQRDLFFSGIGNSSRLKSLDLSGNFDDEEEAENDLLHALQMNRSLRRLKLCLNTVGLMADDIWKTAIVETRLVSIHLWQLPDQTQDLLQYDSLVDVLCRSDCSLKSLSLERLEPSPQAYSKLETTKNSQRIPNKSVKTFSLCNTSLGCAEIMESVGLFKSLVCLTLVGNRICDLSRFDQLLIGENDLTLRDLELFDNQIDEQSLVEFLTKLPRMTRLRRLGLKQNPFVASNGWKQSLVDAIRQNDSIQCITCDTNSGYQEIYSKISVPLSMNRFGRQALELEPSPLRSKLWPFLLERAGRMSYYNYDDWVYLDWHKPRLETTRVDVVFWLLKGIV